MGNKAFIPPDNGKNWWRDIPGYGGKYRASREGAVQRVYPSGRVRNMTLYKKKSKPGRGRLFVKLTINGKSREVPMLKVMAKTWHGSRDKSLVPYHKNGIVTDNHVDNIGFATKSDLGRMTGHKTKKRKSVIKVSEDGEEVEVYRSAREAAKANHMSYQTVLDRCHNRVKKPYALDGHTYQFEKMSTNQKREQEEIEEMMGRLTTNKDASDMSMTQLAHNACYVKDGKARYRDYDMDIDARELARKLLKDYAAGDDAFTCDDDFDEYMLDCLSHSMDDMEGLIALFYRNLWAMAEIHEWLRRYEDLGEQGRLVELPCSVGDRIYVIDTEKGPKNKEIELHDIDNIAILNDGSILLKEDAYDGIICELENIVTDKLYLGIYRCFLSAEEAEAYLEERVGKC